MSLPVKVRTAPEPMIESRLVSSSSVKVPELVKVSVMVKLEAAEVASKLRVAPELMAVVPITLKCLELVSKLPLVPCPMARLPPTFKPLVVILTLAPSAIVKLFKA